MAPWGKDKKKQEKKGKPAPLDFNDPSLRALSSDVLAGERGERVVSAPSPELCLVATRLAHALLTYERGGGTAPVDDVIGLPEFAAYFRPGKSSTSLPRPQGRWEVVIALGHDSERVVGHVDGDWTVEGLDRIAGDLSGKGVVGVDGEGSDSGLSPPPLEPDRELTTMKRALRTSDPATDAGELGAAVGAFAQLVGDRPPRWHHDPAARHDLRYWDGRQWTRFVMDLRADAGR